MSSEPLIGDREYFPGIGPIAYEGPDSDNPLAFKYDDASREVAGKALREHLRFSVRRSGKQELFESIVNGYLR